MSVLPPLLLRADAGGLQGSGHVMRVLALGQAWVDAGGSCILASVDLPEGLAARVAGERGFTHAPLSAAPWTLADADAVRALARAHGAAAIVADSYLLDAAYLGALEASGLRTIAIDDLGRLPRYPCSLLVNPNLAGRPALYEGKAMPETALLGLPYVMLRREFAAHRLTERPIGPVARRLLVTFGGVDPKGASLTALAALARLPDIEADLLIGAANPRAEAIIAAAAGMTNVTLVRAAQDMADRIMRAEMLLSAGGTTVWEAAALGAPIMAAASAPEEAKAAELWARGGGCRYLGRAEELNAETLAASIEDFSGDMAARLRASVLGRELVDGLGAARVVEAIQAISG
jgi:UDP-2,4-diacetamido-2,4,6-trideoxy-beta-L-altropyranose hydrolase